MATGLLLAALTLLAGCDAVSSSPVRLSKDVMFRFEFSTTGKTAGTPFQVNAVGSVGMDDLLAPEGFARDDIIDASVRTVTVRRITPVGTSLDAFGRMSLALTATGVNAPTVADLQNPPDSREANMSVVVPDVSAVVVRPAFGARLTVVPAVQSDEDYVLTATLNLVVDVEGV